MKKIIVTHFNPDLDALCAVWLLKRFGQNFEEAVVQFVPAGETYKNSKVDEDENIIHVDTGLGRFDHHQLEAKTCAAKLVFNYLKSKRKELSSDKALIQLIEVVRQIDHFEEVLWPAPTSDHYNFQLDQLLDGLKNAGKADDDDLVDLGLRCLDGVYSSLKIKNKAKEELEEGVEFMTKWGKAIGCLTQTNEVLKLGQKQGYVLVIQKDAKTDHVRIKARPDSKVDLTEVKERLAKLDPQATWYLHISKRMLLNGSTKNPEMKPSKLSLKKVIEVLKI
jgi:hypothetical protein